MFKYQLFQFYFDMEKKGDLCIKMENTKSNLPMN